MLERKPNLCFILLEREFFRLKTGDGSFAMAALAVTVFARGEGTGEWVGLCETCCGSREDPELLCGEVERTGGEWVDTAGDKLGEFVCAVRARERAGLEGGISKVLSSSSLNRCGVERGK